LFEGIHVLALSHLWPFYIICTSSVWHNSIFFLLYRFGMISVQEELKRTQAS
jgi:hypothetical protein